MALEEYRSKRKFQSTPEPKGAARPGRGNHFVVQEHHATRLHYDFRLEVSGVLVSWAVPKGPSLDPADKRLAIQTEDHPLDYAKFEGTIPAGNYGAGQVIVWDEGTFEPEGSRSAREQIDGGELKMTLHGHKLKGSFVLVKLRGSRYGKPGKEWLLIKHRDAEARTGWTIGEHPESVISGRTLQAESKEASKGAPRAALGRAKPAAIQFPASAKRAPMPEKIAPALATLADKPFSSPEWLFEIKWDGERTLARVKGGQLELWSRSQRNITREYPDLAEIPEHVAGHDVWLDGEIVTLDADGRSNFERLQQRFSVRAPSKELMAKVPVIYYAFDLLYCDGHDLRGVPLLERKNLLAQILHADSRVRFSDHEVARGKELYELATEKHLEGIIGKEIHSRYPDGRTRAWLKFKLGRDLDAVVGGWTDGRKSREHFGALLAGLYEDGKLKYVANVGTGFSNSVQAALAKQLASLAATKCPFDKEPATATKAHWVKPELVMRVGYANWTDGRSLRAPRFLGLVPDRKPEECTFAKETTVAKAEDVDPPEPPRAAKRQASSPKSAQKRGGPGADEEALAAELKSGSQEQLAVEIEGKSLNLTNLNKVYFPGDGYTKRDLLHYYLTISPFLLPFLKGRPLVLRRYPNGIASEAFFQKDAGKKIPEWIETAAIGSDSGKHETIHYFLANDLPSLLYLTNLGCIDHNPWSSRADDREHPDYIFFDLDPSDDTPFPDVIALAKDLVTKLTALRLKIYIKTSGATGIHIFIPIHPHYTFEQVRKFVEVVARWAERDNPGRITMDRTVSKRPKRSIYIDAHQNSRGQSLASVYSVRAFPHAPVSTPIAASELTAKLRPDSWTLKSIPKRIEKIGDLWANFWKDRQDMETAVENLSAKL